MAETIEKVDVPGCLVDEASYALLHKRACDNEAALAALGAHPDQQICTGPFQDCSTRTSWWNGFGEVGGSNWSQVYSNVGNVPQTEGEWVPVGSSVTAPDCPVDVGVTVDTGNHLFYMRRTRAYYWIDVRLLVNGAPVVTETYDRYLYVDKRGATTPADSATLHYETFQGGTTIMHRLNVPAGATLQVEARQRYQTVAAQSSDYFRVIGGLRSQALYSMSPRQIVTGRI